MEKELKPSTIYQNKAYYNMTEVGKFLSLPPASVVYYAGKANALIQNIPITQKMIDMGGIGIIQQYLAKNGKEKPTTDLSTQDT